MGLLVRPAFPGAGTPFIGWGRPLALEAVAIESMPKVNPIPSSEFDLATTGGRRRAQNDLVWADHGFLRAAFSNFHWIEPGKMARANQPSPQRHRPLCGAWASRPSSICAAKADTGYYALEKEACERNAMVLVDQRMHSRQPPSREQIRQAKHLFESIEYPALMHCKSGADRAGAMAVLYAHFAMGLPIAEAMRATLVQIPAREAGQDRNDRLLLPDLSRRDQGHGTPFLQWVEQDYEMEEGGRRNSIRNGGRTFWSIAFCAANRKAALLGGALGRRSWEALLGKERRPLIRHAIAAV